MVRTYRPHKNSRSKSHDITIPSLVEPAEGYQFKLASEIEGNTFPIGTLIYIPVKS